jgi:predicted transcriptional regulator
MIARLIREAELRYNLPLSVILKPEEKLIADVIENGAFDIRDIIRESHLTKADVLRILHQMIEAGFIERRKQGGKTEQARGAVTYLYVIKSLPKVSVDQSIV